MKKELLAPNGKPSKLTPEQYKLVRTPAFKKWFGDWENDTENASKVVDENGEPLVVYHGTASDFNIFKIGRTGGIFLTNNKNSAERFSSGDLKRIGSNPKILNCFLNIKKYYDKNTNDEILVDNYYQDYFENRPFIKKQSQKNILKNKFNKYFWDLVSFGIVNEEPLNFLIKKGYDGIIIDSDNNSNSYIVFESNQIKLADGSNTTFDGSNPDIRFKNGGEIDEYAQQLIDIISSNPQLEKYQKYKVILKDKFGINFDDFYKDDYYIENANISEIKVNDDFINYDKYIEYAKKIFRLRGLINDYHAQNIEGIVSIDKAIEIGKKLNFIVEHKEYDGGSGNYASHTIDTITMPNKVDINAFIHEIGHHYDHFESKEYKGLANTSTYASSLYEIGKSDEVFAENFKNYFIAPNWLKEKLPMVYNELDKNINDVYKEEIYKLINSSKEIYRLGGEINTGLFSQIWGWFGIKF